MSLRSVFICLALLPHLAVAEETAPARATRRDHGVSLGVRTAYGAPLGYESGQDKLSDSIAGAVPIWVDVGYRINPHIYLGVFGQYAFGLAPHGYCQTALDCSESVMRFGANAHYHFLPDRLIDPWVGFGIGYEFFSFRVSGTIPVLQWNVDASGTESGFEFANFQLGGDIRVSPDFALGPFVAVSLAQYSSATGGASIGSSGPNGVNNSIQDRRLHGWLMFGLRAILK